MEHCLVRLVRTEHIPHISEFTNYSVPDSEIFRVLNHPPNIRRGFFVDVLFRAELRQPVQIIFDFTLRENAIAKQRQNTKFQYSRTTQQALEVFRVVQPAAYFVVNIVSNNQIINQSCNFRIITFQPVHFLIAFDRRSGQKLVQPVKIDIGLFEICPRLFFQRDETFVFLQDVVS